MSGRAAGTDLLERTRERQAIADALRSAGAGAGTIGVIEGPPGVGKTVLLDLLSRMAADEGARVRAARGSELESEFAFGVVLQLLEPLVEEGGEGMFDGAAALARPLFERAEAGAGTEFQLLHGLYWLCANLSERGTLVLCLDDAQWSDAASLRFLAYLGARTEELPVLIALTRRSGEPNPPAALQELAALPIASTLAPGELSREAVTEIVVAELGDEAGERLAGEISSRSGGNPLFVGELVRSAREAAGEEGSAALDGSPPDTVVSLVERRVERLPAEVQTTAAALAILGDAAELPEVEASPSWRTTRSCSASTGSPRAGLPIPRASAASATRSCARP